MKHTFQKPAPMAVTREGEGQVPGQSTEDRPSPTAGGGEGRRGKMVSKTELDYLYGRIEEQQERIQEEIQRLGDAREEAKLYRKRADEFFEDNKKLAVELQDARAKSEENREGWAACAMNAATSHFIIREYREFVFAYFIDGVLRFGEQDGKPWTYREEARRVLSMGAEDGKSAIAALKATYARGHYCDMGDKCPGCMAGNALEALTGRQWTQDECGVAQPAAPEKI